MSSKNLNRKNNFKSEETISKSNNIHHKIKHNNSELDYKENRSNHESLSRFNDRNSSLNTNSSSSRERSFLENNKNAYSMSKSSGSNTKMNSHLFNQTRSLNNSNLVTESSAKERWNILKKAILNKSLTNQNSKISKRRFNSFGLIKCIKIAYSTQHENENYRLSNNSSKFSHKNRYNENESDKSSDDDYDVVSYARDSRASNNHKYENKLISKNTKNHSNNFEWHNISVPSVDPNLFIKVRFYNGSVNLNDLTGFNNTGNICLWPSEEIMTYFCIKNSVIFDNKSICELGGGMTCLGGLMISKCSQPTEVFLTDGNEASFENLEVICSENDFECSVECCLLQWKQNTNYGDLEERFDYIICADCLFFDEFREDLCATIYKLLKSGGTCLIFAPNRQNTFHKFVDLAKVDFECMIVHDYDLDVWERHLYEKETNPDYDEDIHYPLLLKLKKRTRSTNDFCKMVL